jgi:sialate O-acetylesterase
LNRDLDVPIGLIDSNKGGTRIELWTPAETLGMKKKPVEENGKAKGNSVLYNGMIAPLMPFAIKGVIWYQGEATGPASIRHCFELAEPPASSTVFRHRGQCPVLIAIG